MKKVPSNYISGHSRRAKSIENLIDIFEETIGDSDYSIATIDATSKGTSLGRGVIHFGSFIDNGDYSLKNHVVNERLVFKIVPRSFLIIFAKTFIGNKIIECFFKLHSAGYTKFFENKPKVFSRRTDPSNNSTSMVLFGMKSPSMFSKNSSVTMNGGRSY